MESIFTFQLQLVESGWAALLDYLAAYDCLADTGLF